MGKYINEINGSILPAIRKAARIKELLPETEQIAQPKSFQPNLVCVVSNGSFEAAGYCYNQGEFEAFTYGDDPRPKTWLVVPDAEKYAK